MTDSILPEFQSFPKQYNFRDLTGDVYHRWTVLGYAGLHGNTRRVTCWWCVCECGTIKRLKSYVLTTGGSQSCGCFKRDWTINHFTTHGEARKTPEYAAYEGAKGRCRNPNNHKYPRYGARGIEFRFASYSEFLEEIDRIGRRPSSKYTLDRIDNNGHYEPGNVRWDDGTTQARNTSANKLLVIDGISKCVTEWAETSPVPAQTIFSRLIYGWCDTCAVFIPRYGTCIHRYKENV